MRIYCIKKVVFLSLILLSILGCRDKKTAEIEKVVKEWTGKEIIFPENLQCKWMDRDTVCPELFDKPYKVLVYVDSVGCTSCKLKLPEWEEYILETEKIIPGKVSFLFFFTPKSERELIHLLKTERFEYPIFMDKDEEINKLNRFPSGNMMFQCFLLDGNNQVLIIGNPILNPQIEELYKQRIIE